MKFRFDIFRVITFTAVFSLALIYPLLWMKMLSDPIQYTGADFIAFYAAGRIADNEGASQVYDLRLQQKYEREVVGVDFEFSETNPFVHPPFVVPFAQLAATPNYLASFQFWALLMLFLFAAGIPFFVSLVKKSFSWSDQWIFAMALFLFFPSFQSIILGQDNALMFLGIALWMWGLIKKRDWVSGLGLALTTIRPHLALFLLLPFLLQRRFILAWFALFSFLLVAISLPYAGFDGIAGFLRILTVSGGGENFKINEDSMINLIGILRRVAAGISPETIRLIGWLSYALALFLLAFYFWRGSINLQYQISIAAVFAVFFSPHSHVQDLLMLIIPMIVLALILIEKHIFPPNRVNLLFLGISMVLLFGYSSPILLYSIPYMLMAALLYFISRLQSENFSIF